MLMLHVACFCCMLHVACFCCMLMLHVTCFCWSHVGCSARVASWNVNAPFALQRSTQGLLRQDQAEGGQRPAARLKGQEAPQAAANRRRGRAGAPSRGDARRTRRKHGARHAAAASGRACAAGAARA